MRKCVLVWDDIYISFDVRYYFWVYNGESEEDGNIILTAYDSVCAQNGLSFSLPSLAVMGFVS